MRNEGVEASSSGKTQQPNIQEAAGLDVFPNKEEKKKF